jgi:hypothetical protein
MSSDSTDRPEDTPGNTPVVRAATMQLENVVDTVSKIDLQLGAATDVLTDLAVDSVTKKRSSAGLLLMAAIGLIASALLWGLALFYPSAFFSNGPQDRSLNEYLVIALIAFPFLTVFGALRLAFPELEEGAELESGPMAGFFYREKVSKRRRILIVAGIVGAINLIVTIAVVTERAG